ncbi:MAG: isoprenylcysteine carboxylmethyltransferase family protein [Campylobacteraceae bacterium]|nr:isoprenylcysteine carboxylmethyltransferase family protein [Campylobacteraceae bacterium]
MKFKTSVSVVIRILLWVTMLVGGAVYGISKDVNNPIWNSLFFHISFLIIGYFILVFAFRSAANGGRELKKGRVGDIPRLETNHLVTTGIYDCMRHPMLFGLTLLPLGTAFIIGSPTFISIVAPLEMLFIIFMVIVFEEWEVRKKFGQEYKDYRLRVPMVSLAPECLKKLFSKILI